MTPTPNTSRISIFEAARMNGAWQGLKVITPEGISVVIKTVKKGRAKIIRFHNGKLQGAWIPLENLTAKS